MEKILYSRKGKALFIMLQNMCIIAVTACILTVIFFSNMNDADRQGNLYGTHSVAYNGIGIGESVTDFEESIGFSNMLYDSVNEIARFAVIREQMEKDGDFDGSKKIDIVQFANRYSQLDQESNVSYYLEDLIKWGQYGLFYVNGDSYVSDEESFSPANGYIYQEDITPEINYSEKEMTTEIQKVEIPEAIKILERYQPIGAESLAVYASDPISYEVLCNDLYETIQSLSYNYYQYRQFQSQYQAEQTNLRYYVETTDEESKNTYSNLAENREAGGEEAYIKEMERYICYDAKALSYSTNTKIAESEIIDILNSFEYAFSDNSKIMIGVDTDYPVQDIYAEANSNFNTIGQWIEPILIIIVSCVCLYLLLLILLTIAAGRKLKDSEISLQWFDNLNTEGSLCIVAAVCFCAALIGVLGVEFLYMNNIDQITVSICITIGVLIANLLFTFFYLSFVRRMKGHLFFRNSLFCRIFRFIGSTFKKTIRNMKAFFLKVIDNGDVTVRTWVPYLLFLAANFLLIQIGVIGVLCAILLDVLIGGYLFNENRLRKKIVDGIEVIKDGNTSCQVDTVGMHGDNMILAESVNTLGAAISKAVETSIKDERLKTDLITNVSHDIKTPLTSIINYVDLIKREDIKDEKIKGYINILDVKSQRLKHLTEDLVEASKISSGNITLQITKLNFIELLNQTIGEFSESFAQKDLQLVLKVPEYPVVIEADSRRMWRVIENLFRNIEKYAMERTRVYIDVTVEEVPEKRMAHVLIKNISRNPLNINAEDLTERFIRGDVSRSTEGSGLGLSIVKNLLQLQGGSFGIYLDGDLFKAMIDFPMVDGEIS